MPGNKPSKNAELTELTEPLTNIKKLLASTQKRVKDLSVNISSLQPTKLSLQAPDDHMMLYNSAIIKQLKAVIEQEKETILKLQLAIQLQTAKIAGQQASQIAQHRQHGFWANSAQEVTSMLLTKPELERRVPNLQQG